MARFIKGDVVVIPFPFSDLSDIKKRPALVLADLKGNDIILCQITSQTINDEYSIVLSDEDFIEGSLKTISNIRPSRIFTADKEIILKKVGRINQNLYKKVTSKIADLIE